jgi:hypothetical protein
MSNSKQKIIDTLRSFKPTDRDVDKFVQSVGDKEKVFRDLAKAQIPTQTDRHRQYTL